MRRFLLFMLLSVICTTTFAQKQLTEAQSQEVMSQLTQAATSMRTLQCRFVQEKLSSMLVEPSVSEGTLHYKAPSRMRWEYVKPYAFALVVSGDRIVKITNGKSEALEGNSNRIFQGIVNIIMGSASGKKLFDLSVFDVVMHDDGTFWKAEMTPKRRDMKRMFSQLVFHFDKKSQIIDHLEFIEPQGDRTVIRFEEVQINEKIAEEKFQ